MSRLKWRNALTGEPADPLIREGPYHSKVDYNSYQAVENDHKAWFVVAPGVTNLKIIDQYTKHCFPEDAFQSTKRA